MPTQFNGRSYLNRLEVAARLHCSPQHVSTKIKGVIVPDHFAGNNKGWYEEVKVEDLANGQMPRVASVKLYGYQSNWAKELADMGYNIEQPVTNCTISQPHQRIRLEFGLPDEEYVQRGRIAFASGTPICAWDTFYLRSLVSDIPEETLRDERFSIVNAMKERGLIVGRATDSLITREATFEENNKFQLRARASVIQIQRPVYTREGKFLFYTDMSLLGHWFKPTYSYAID
jgi:hypothetical protein